MGALRCSDLLFWNAVFCVNDKTPVYLLPESFSLLIPGLNEFKLAQNWCGLAHVGSRWVLVRIRVGDELRI